VELVADPPETLLAQVVEQDAFPPVRQDLIGLGHLLETLCGLGVLVLVAVPVVAQCLLAERHTDLVVSGSATEAQQLVEVLGHGSVVIPIRILKLNKNCKLS